MSRLSYSRSYTYQKCQKLYDYQYHQKLAPRGGTIKLEYWKPRVIGQLIHAGMEAGLLGKPLEAALAETAREITERGVDAEKALALVQMQQDAAQIAQDCLDWLPAADFRPVVHKGQPLVEAELIHPIKGWDEFMGYVDLVAEHIPTGRVLVIDYKSKDRFSKPEDEAYALQFLLYMKALSHMGVHVDGAYVVQIKSELPKGKLRKIRTDVGGIDGPRTSTDGRFQATPTFHSKEYINNAWNNFEKLAIQMTSFDPARAFTNLSGWQCGNCDFRKLCQAELRNEDYDYIRRSSYKPKYDNTYAITPLTIEI